MSCIVVILLYYMNEIPSIPFLPKMYEFAKMAIDVFNQRQATKHSLVDLISANRGLFAGFVVHVVFTAKSDDDDEYTKTFHANIHTVIGRPKDVTYVVTHVDIDRTNVT
ncbi:hypothetical protein ABFX02_06G076100 [Erythranthe guttata]